MNPPLPGEPLDVTKLRASLAVGAGLRFSNLWKVGDYLSIVVSDRNGKVYYETALLRELESEYRFIVPLGPRYRVRVIITRFFGKNLEPYHRSSRLPFYFFPHKRKKKRTGLILVKGRGSGDSRQPVLSARLKLNSAKPRLRYVRQSGSKLLSGRPNPTITYSTITRRNFTNGTEFPPVGGSSFRYASYVRGWSSRNTPGFRTTRRKRIRLPINPYSCNITEVHDGHAIQDNWTSDGSGSFSTHVNAYQDFWGTRAFGGDPQRPAMDGSVDFRAIMKLIDRMGPSKSNLPEAFATMGQTVKMIADTATKINMSIRNLRSGNIPMAMHYLSPTSSVNTRGRHGPSVKKSVADNWLALQYGWKPLLQDIQGAMESVAQLNLGQTQTWTTRSSASSNVVGNQRLYQNVASGRETGAQSWVSRSTVRYGLRWKYDDHLTSFLAQTGFTNPISLAWELLPYSFVADWFIPIGPYLQALSAWDGLKFVDGWKTSMQEVINTWDVSYSGPSNPSDPRDVHMEQLTGACWHRYFVYDRIPLSGFPSPKLPSFKNPLSVTHAANAVALVISNFKVR